MKKNLWATIIMRSCAVILFIICIFAAESVLADNIISNDGIERVYGQNQFMKYVYEQMQKREEEIVVKYIGNDYLDVFELFEKEEFLDKVADIDDPTTSDDFDYLGNNLSKMKTSINIKYSGAAEAIFNINIDWRETYDETQAVNQAVRELIDSLALKDMNTYEKIKTAHDYIIDNVEYDIDCNNENAYTAVFDKKSTCQGYSLLFYKIMTEVGVNCRYVTGTGINEESGPHGWNIVQIEDKWYNVDVTWDDPVYINASGTIERNEMNYVFFLKGTGEFDESHVRDDKFTTEDFKAQYPMATVDFDEASYSGDNMIYTSSDALEWSFTKEEEIGAKGLYRKVILSDFGTYRNMFPNIIQGFGNLSVEKGFFGAIGDSWIELSILNKFVVIIFFVVIGLNVAYGIIDKKMNEEEDKLDISELQSK